MGLLIYPGPWVRGPWSVLHAPSHSVLRTPTRPVSSSSFTKEPLEARRDGGRASGPAAGEGRTQRPGRGGQCPVLCAVVHRVLVPSSEQLVATCTSLVLRDLRFPPGQPSVHRLAALKVQGGKNEADSLACRPGGRCGPLWLGWWLSVRSEVSGAALSAGKGAGPGPYGESQGLLRGRAQQPGPSRWLCSPVPQSGDKVSPL